MMILYNPSDFFFVKSSPKLNTETSYNGNHTVVMQNSFLEVKIPSPKWSILGIVLRLKCVSQYYSRAAQFSNCTNPSHW